MWRAQGALLGCLLVRRSLDQLRSREGMPQQRRGAAAQQVGAVWRRSGAVRLQSADDGAERVRLGGPVHLPTEIDRD